LLVHWVPQRRRCSWVDVRTRVARVGVAAAAAAAAAAAGGVQICGRVVDCRRLLIHGVPLVVAQRVVVRVARCACVGIATAAAASSPCPCIRVAASCAGVGIAPASTCVRTHASTCTGVGVLVALGSCVRIIATPSAPVGVFVLLFLLPAFHILLAQWKLTVLPAHHAVAVVWVTHDPIAAVFISVAVGVVVLVHLVVVIDGDVGESNRRWALFLDPHVDATQAPAILQ
jgi:hypothetical protein